MLKEIGSEFWGVPTTSKANNLFPETTSWYLSGRSALQVIIRDLSNAKSVAMPSWCCDSMIKPFLDAGIKVNFYPVYWQDGLRREINFDSDILFLMDYFGYTNLAPNIQRYNGIVIRDVTHSIFSATYSDADYYFGSLRKWCGFWTGGYAWTKDKHVLAIGETDNFGYERLRAKAMQLKARYINGDPKADKSYLKAFEEAEDLLETVNIAKAAKRDVELVAKMDIEFIRNRRRLNAEILREAFSEWLIFPQQSDLDTPMFVPILVPDGKRNELRTFLIKSDIYCPVHWPVSEYHNLSERERFIYDNELSLVCDQRYVENDMRRMVDAITQFWKEA